MPCKPHCPKRRLPHTGRRLKKVRKAALKNLEKELNLLRLLVAAIFDRQNEDEYPDLLRLRTRAICLASGCLPRLFKTNPDLTSNPNPTPDDPSLTHPFHQPPGDLPSPDPDSAP